jgi:hypothetical protein
MDVSKPTHPGYIKKTDSSNYRLFVPIRFSIDTNQPRALVHATVEDIKADNETLIKFESESGIHALSSKSTNQDLVKIESNVKPLRDEEPGGFNTLFFEVTLIDCDQAVLEASNLEILISITFSRGEHITFLVKISTNVDLTSINVRDIERYETPYLPLINLLLLTALASLALFWGTRVSGVNGKTIPGELLGALLGIVLSFFGLNLAQLFGLVNQAENLSFLAKFPELRLSPKTFNTLNTRVALLIVTICWAASLFIFLTHKTIRLPEIASQGIIIDINNKALLPGQEIFTRDILQTQIQCSLHSAHPPSLGTLELPTCPWYAISCGEASVKYTSFAIEIKNTQDAKATGTVKWNELEQWAVPDDFTRLYSRPKNIKVDIAHSLCGESISDERPYQIPPVTGDRIVIQLDDPNNSTQYERRFQRLITDLAIRDGFVPSNRKVAIEAVPWLADQEYFPIGEGPVPFKFFHDSVVALLSEAGTGSNASADWSIFQAEVLIQSYKFNGRKILNPADFLNEIDSLYERHIIPALDRRVGDDLDRIRGYWRVLLRLSEISGLEPLADSVETSLDAAPIKKTARRERLKEVFRSECETLGLSRTSVVSAQAPPTFLGE